MAIAPISGTNRQSVSALPQESRNERKTQTNTAQEIKMTRVTEDNGLGLSEKAKEYANASIKLMSQMKQNNYAGKGTGDMIQNLVNAYDDLHKELNPNSENSNKHGKVLDEAFKDIAKILFKRSISRPAVPTTSEPLTPMSSTSTSGVKPIDSPRVDRNSWETEYVKSSTAPTEEAQQKTQDIQELLLNYRTQQYEAEQKASAFAEQFLKDYKKLGIAAYTGY